ncbi:MAG: hypothetical protein IKP46_02315 [Bacteroidales bacterium]|nr:hypothetical protein [Bacteroidales bacterium]
MTRSLRRILLLSLALAASVAASGQKKDRSDSLVTLISAKSAQLLEENGYHYRKVIGPARFFHNNTYLLCDTALWNTDTRIIKAYGHVKLIQDQTTLTSETADYVIDEDMAKFRGSVVQLEDKDKNVLRTRYLDYNTKDSVAIFQSGGAMRDKDGQIIESRYGSYEAKEKKFTFMDGVNMYTDSVFVKTSRLMYRSDENTAYFGYGTDAWKDDGMLSADDGYYKRDIELFFFRKRVHIMNEKQEGWSDSLFYDKGLFTVEMLGHAEVMDTTRNAYGLAGRLEYIDSLSRVKMTRDPAVMSVSESDGRRDTLYIGADTLIFLSMKKCDIAQAEINAAETRLTDLAGDPVTEYRRKAAEAAAKAAEEAAANDPNRPPDLPPGAKQKGAPPEEAAASEEIPSPAPQVRNDNTTSVISSEAEKSPPDSTSVSNLSERLDSLDRDDSALADSLGRDDNAPADTLAAPVDTLTAPVDTLTAPADTLPPPDTTKIDIAYAISRVKMFREDTQFVCDSLVYTALDSLYRLYIDPIVYNEGNRQYVADSIFVATKNGAIDKASLMSNAFVTTAEDTTAALFDQIKGAEVLAYFDSTAALKRFDGLGGASAIFYLEENGSLATVNKVESKMLSALFVDGQVEKIFYFDEAKNDAYPVVQLPKEERQLKGFRWEPEKRPEGREDVTPLVPRPSERKEYASHERPDFKETAVYFPGHMAKIYKMLEERDSLDAAAARRRAAAAREASDSLSFDTLRDSLSAIGDSLGVDGVHSASGLDNTTDSLSVNPGDSLSVIPSGAEKSDTTGKIHVPTREELKALQKAERERKRAEKQAALEAKWAEKDRIDAEKAAAKAEKAKARKRKRTLKFLQKQKEQEEKDARILERYKQRYAEKLQKKKDRKK